jgi:hypothetical protein
VKRVGEKSGGWIPVVEGGGKEREWREKRNQQRESGSFDFIHNKFASARPAAASRENAKMDGNKEAAVEGEVTSCVTES